MAKVLIVEDNESVRALLRLTLDTGRFELLECEDGERALELARQHRPDLIFLDWGLPGRSGIDVCRALRADPHTAGAKIVMVTARISDEDRAEGLDAGADDYITKPFSPLQLLDKVREALGVGALL